MSYVLSQSRAIVGEDTGSNVVITLTTTGLPNGTLVPYEISGTNVDTSDFIGLSSLQGNFNQINNVGRVTLNIAADQRTEGTETFFLTLTGPGRSETIGVSISDTSVQPFSTNPSKIFISSSKTLIREGETVTFFVRGENIPSGTVVPYTILGISSLDIVGGASSGSVTLITDPGTGIVQGNITLGIIEDFTTEGPESIFLLVQPSFPYVLEINNTVTVIDNSVDTTPRAFLDIDKRRVSEGSNILLSVFALNIPDGTVLSWEIIPFESEITIGDFRGLSNLSGVFPPLVSNVANVTIQVSDDFLFEQSEYFYFYQRDYNASSQLIEIIDSGNTLLVSDATFTGNVFIQYLDKAILRANVAGLSIGKSNWEDSTGKISDTMVLQGRSAFAAPGSAAVYQPFSYIIRSDRSIEEWRNSVISLLHPAGFTLFSEINNETELFNINSANIKASVPLEIEEVFALSSDSVNFTIDSNLYSNSRFSLLLKADLSYYFHRYL